MATAIPNASAASCELPPEVVACLKNARYLHLATSDGLWPHVSLMNYTYLPTTPYRLPPNNIRSSTSTSGPVIVMTTHPGTKKTLNLTTNPRVSLLVHDWVSHRPSISSTNPFSTSPTLTTHAFPTAAAEQPPQPSSLSAFLTNLNSAALSSISATLNGYAHLIPQGSEEEEYYRRVHMENNPQSENRCYLEGEEVRVVVVRIGWARVADYRGGVTDWRASDEEEVEGGDDGGMGAEVHTGVGIVNGA
ncbi:uncharacterized protein LAJ45_06665 [Morchella importuna]|uniref:Pyridoxamine 5'-phosphate oxidase N-terminal domain-containing protein n=1 Tax=Morchella conica CCBAS932 TaxID=1392247 RepID=A0A3N4KE32_9PEZI|nr:uncharacterized protein LAJ45_06665 [Morchella importuna]KAH8149126.1 hypothetical protein LAJ45_06665 [Morchella importuna]RPB08747.1 hypothetical protein P167DRAFT_528125 [Morchella conica CCBAS932]